MYDNDKINTITDWLIDWLKYSRLLKVSLTIMKRRDYYEQW